jgi:hypothetical protein
MLSVLDIVNLALVKIGSAKISALTDKTDINLSNVYAQERDKLLTRYPWNFARAREAIEPNDEAPAFEWDYEYDLPDDYLGRPELYGSTSPFEIEGNTLLCNDDTIKLKYTTQITDTYMFTSLFIECLVLAIASEIATPIANDATLKMTIQAELKAKALDAFLLNEFDNNKEPKEEDFTWQEAG